MVGLYPPLVAAPDLRAFTQDCQALVQRRPVVHALPVAASAGLVANALHAVGASPVMAVLPREIGPLHRLCSAVVLTLGSPDQPRFRLLDLVARSARVQGLPVVLDPVGVGFSPPRWRWARRWTARSRGWVIRGNRSEIEALVGPPPRRPKGAIDAPLDGNPPAPWEAFRGLADLAERHTVLATGPVDDLQGSGRGYRGARGHELQARVTGMGCALSALVAAFRAVNPDPFVAALHALWLATASAERAALLCQGPGTFPASWLDGLAWLVQNPAESWDQNHKETVHD